MFTLSAFADEVSADLTEQMDVLEKEGVKHIELRGVWGKNVLDLTDEEVGKVREEASARGFAMSAIGSPIGKIDVTDPFEPHVERFRRAIRVAKELGAPYIRVFSYFIPKGADPALHRDEVMRRMRAKAEIAEAEGVTLLHENEMRIYGEVADRCRDIHDAVPSERLKAIFDPANYVHAHEDMPSAWEKMRDLVVYFHIKDAREVDGKVVPAGKGDGNIEAMLRDAVARGFDGFASLEPHLRVAGASHGETGPELFKVAADALKEVIARAGGAIRAE